MTPEECLEIARSNKAETYTFKCTSGDLLTVSFRADELLAFARQVEQEALEKAAKVCESRPALFRKAEFEEVRQDANLSCARDIRALKGRP